MVFQRFLVWGSILAHQTTKFKLSEWFCFSRHPRGPWGRQSSGMKPKSADSVAQPHLQDHNLILQYVSCNSIHLENRLASRPSQMNSCMYLSFRSIKCLRRATVIISIWSVENHYSDTMCFYLFQRSIWFFIHLWFHSKYQRIWAIH